MGLGAWALQERQLGGLVEFVWGKASRKEDLEETVLTPGSSDLSPALATKQTYVTYTNHAI